MDNNDVLIRLRYALDIKDADIVEIFKLGGMDLTINQVKKLLLKSKDALPDEEDDMKITEENIRCSNEMLDAFLNGFIIFKRGKQDPKTGQAAKPILSITGNSNINNIIFKKLKIALEFSSEDILDILEEAGIVISPGELSAVFRKEGHKNYRECGDRYIRNFLKGLTIRYRK